MLIEIDKEGLDPLDPRMLHGRAIIIGGVRGGRVLEHARWQGRPVLLASLRRQHRVEGLRLQLAVEGSAPDGTPAGRQLSGTVRSLPLICASGPAAKADELHERASALFARDLEDQAVALLELALDVDPGHADSFESLGVILGRRGDLEGAAELMQRLLEVDPGSVMAHTNLSMLYSRMGRIAEAEHERAAAARAAAVRSRLEAEAAETEEQEHQRRRAELARREQMLRKVLELDEADPMARLGIGELCVVSGRFNEARQHLQRALEQDSGYSAAYLALGKAFEGLNDRDSARLVYTRGVEVAARKGDLAVAGQIQGRLSTL
jgi:tetratricopeptide (TPR) repeat protein